MYTNRDVNRPKNTDLEFLIPMHNFKSITIRTIANVTDIKYVIFSRLANL